MSQNQKKPFYITTTLPYVNAVPHIGHALEFVRADTIARWKKIRGFEVFFNTGTDEHGLKIYEKAISLGLTPQAYVDGAAKEFREILPLLGILEDVNFIRTTDKHHIESAQALWNLVAKNGFIYKKNYKVKYCVGCELEKTDSELVDGRCEFHPNRDLELIEEENYFFKFSILGDKLKELYESRIKSGDPLVIPETRQKEISAFVSRGLQDFSISRLASKMPWGIPVPNDPEQVMYVWFDALTNYISAIGWPQDKERFTKWAVNTGGMVQYCGKDNLRQQSAMWQAMLIAGGLPTSQKVIIDGFATGEGGVKMSKSLGNVIDPVALIKEYGTDAMRYYCLRELHPFEDSPCTEARFKESYNSALANGLGNLASRILKMSSTNITGDVVLTAPAFSKEYIEAMDSYDIQKAMHIVWEKIASMDSYIQEKKPFSLIKTNKDGAIEIIKDLLQRLYEVAFLLEPMLPSTSKSIVELVKENKMPEKPLFLRK